MRIVLLLLCFVGFVLGILVMVSPFYSYGGAFNLVFYGRTSDPDAGLRKGMNSLLSIGIGFCITFGAAIFAFVLASVFGIEASTKATSNKTSDSTHEKSD